jgi:hypothetical protein
MYTCLLTKYKHNFFVAVCIEIPPINIFPATTPIPHEARPNIHPKFSPQNY